MPDLKTQFPPFRPPSLLPNFGRLFMWAETRNADEDSRAGDGEKWDNAVVPARSLNNASDESRRWNIISIPTTDDRRGRLPTIGSLGNSD